MNNKYWDAGVVTEDKERVISVRDIVGFRTDSRLATKKLTRKENRIAPNDLSPELLEALQDELDNNRADAALQEAHMVGIRPWADLKAELGL
jgi:hypothetical protein